MILGSKCCCESECDDCRNKECDDKNYDYVFLICNSNSAKDDEWSLNLNGYDLGNVSELGINRCQGKFFYTDINLLNFIKEDVFNPDSRNIRYNQYCGKAPVCCLRNTFTYTTASEVSAGAFAYCGTGPFLKMTLTKQNFNGNYGNIYIWRRPFYYDGTRKINGQLCRLQATTYSASTREIGYTIYIELTQLNS